MSRGARDCLGGAAACDRRVVLRRRVGLLAHLTHRTGERAARFCKRDFAVGRIELHEHLARVDALRVGDVLTVPVHTSVRVVRVLSLAVRRGPAAEARLLYEEIS